MMKEQEKEFRGGRTRKKMGARVLVSDVINFKLEIVRRGKESQTICTGGGSDPSRGQCLLTALTELQWTFIM